MPQEQFSGVVVLSEKKYKELEEKGKIENTKLYTNSQFINTPTKVSQLENDEQYLKEGDIKIVNSLNSSSHTSALSALQGKKINDRLTKVESSVNGTPMSFTVENLAELGNLFGIEINDTSNSYHVNTNEIIYKETNYELNNGDTFFIIDSDVPDYWFSKDNLTLYKIEGNTIQTNLEIEVDNHLSLDSENPVQNKVVSAALNSKATKDLATVEQNGLMSFQDKNKLNSLGLIVETSVADMVVKDGVKTNIASFELTAGTWIIIGDISYTPNIVGYRSLYLTNGSIKTMTCDSGTTNLNCSELRVLVEKTNADIYAQQNSGSSLVVNGKISAIRIA